MTRTRTENYGVRADRAAVLLNDAHYHPNKLLNIAMERLRLTTDYQLAGLLQIQQTRLSSVRRKKVYMTSQILLRIMHFSGMTLSECLTLGGIDIMLVC